MAFISNKSSLDNMMKAVLAPANTEQNQVLPPYIFDNMYNTVAAFLINALVKEFPNNPLYVDMLEPFIVAEKVQVIDGYITLPDEYRNFLDVGYNMKKDGKGECGSEETPIQTTEKEFTEEIKRRGCISRPINIVSQSEWDERTTSTYNFPTYQEAIGCFFGKGQIKVCPYDIGKAEIRYIRQEQIYRYGYITQPDDTFVFDPSTTVESEFTSAAFNHIYKAMTALFAAYTKNPEMRDFSLILNQRGILS